MANDGQQQSTRFHDLQSIKALLLDPAIEQGSDTKDRMIEIGLRDVGTCAKAADLQAAIQERQPDLLLLDLDGDRTAVCQAIQDIRSQTIKTDNPFAVIVGVTADSGREGVAEALGAGVDAMLAKPVAAAALRACLREQVEDRAEFIATADYVGPDRRPEGREASDEELVSLEVPNTLQQKAQGEAGEAGGGAIEERIAETLRSLGAQRSWMLARRVSTLAENARLAMTSGNDFPLLGECLEAIDGTLTKLECLDAELNLASLREVVASARSALDAVSAAGEGITARHFELLRVHGDSVGVAMQQDESLRDALVTELGRAVAAVRGEALSADGESTRSRAHSWKVRLRAWWDGVEPEDIAAAS